MFNSDVGLFITLAFKDKKYTENIIYNKLLSDKLDVNLGYVYENVVAKIMADFPNLIISDILITFSSYTAFYSSIYKF